MKEKSNERRGYERNFVEAPIIFSEYNTDYFYGAILQNCSLEGVYFESDRPLEPGVDIWVKSSNFSTDVLGTGDEDQSYRAEVVWCKELDKDEWFSYGIGARYYEPLC